MMNKWKIAFRGFLAGIVCAFFGSLIFAPLATIITILSEPPDSVLRDDFVMLLFFALLFSLMFTLIPACIAGIVLAFRLSAREKTDKEILHEGGLIGGAAGGIAALAMIAEMFFWNVDWTTLLFAGLGILTAAGMGALAARWLARKKAKFVESPET